MTVAALVIGDRSDLHVKAVLDAIAEHGGPEPIVFDAEMLRTVPYCLTGNGCLSIGDRSVELTHARGWLRRTAPTLWGAGSTIGSLEAVRKRSFLSLTGAISRVSGVEWLTPVDAMLTAEDRLLQLEKAHRLGYRVPDTLVTSSSDQARHRLGDHFVVKPLGLGYFHDRTGPKAVFASMISASDLSSVDFSDAPFLAQEIITARQHLRIVTVGGRAWTGALPAEGFQLDWRRSDDAHASWTPASEPAAERAAIDLAQSFGLGFSSQDWICAANGDLVFLDLNPGGQWLFLPPAVSTQATQAIASHLIGETRT